MRSKRCIPKFYVVSVQLMYIVCLRSCDPQQKLYFFCSEIFANLVLATRTSFKKRNSNTEQKFNASTANGTIVWIRVRTVGTCIFMASFNIKIQNINTISFDDEFWRIRDIDIVRTIVQNYIYYFLKYITREAYSVSCPLCSFPMVIEVCCCCCLKRLYRVPRYY